MTLYTRTLFSICLTLLEHLRFCTLADSTQTRCLTYVNFNGSQSPQFVFRIPNSFKHWTLRGSMRHLHSSDSILVYHTAQDRKFIHDDLEEHTASAFKVAESNSFFLKTEAAWCNNSEYCRLRSTGGERLTTCTSTCVTTCLIRAKVAVFHLRTITTYSG